MVSRMYLAESLEHVRYHEQLYSLSIALQENALRVTSLLLVISGSAAADLRLLAGTFATEARPKPG